MASEQRRIDTSGGDYAEGNIDKRAGVNADNSSIQAHTIAGTIGQQINRNYSIARSAWQQPFALPPMLPGYVDRTSAEDQLRRKLDGASTRPIVLLHGRSGNGKTALAAKVLKSLKQTFTGGILYQSLDNLAPNEVLGSFLQQFDNDWQYRSQENQLLRDYFWSRLSRVEKPALLVFDHVRNEQQLESLLPPTTDALGRCRVLLISTLELVVAGELQVDPLALPGLEADEAQTLFRQIVGVTKVEQYREQLSQISVRLEGNPLLITGIAHKLINETISPSRYLSLVVNKDAELLTDEKIAQVERSIGGLREDARALIPLLGVLGSGDWAPAMLAAVALRPTIAVCADLPELVEQGLIRVVRRDRYQTNGIVRLVAQQQFERWDSYRKQAAATLLARYCLDLAQDLEVELNAKPPFRQRSAQQASHVDEAYILEFRNRILDDLSHFRQSIAWAANHESWDALRRFAFTPYLELVDRFAANAGEIQMSLCMSTLLAPVVWPAEGAPVKRLKTIISTNDWTWRAPDPKQRAHDLDDPAQGHDAPACELCWDITSGAISGGVLRAMRLTHSRWIGVRAQELICVDVDVVGGRFLACDFSNSVWLRCDARHVMLRGANFAGALLRRVLLHSADLQQANFSGAILEYVTLRNADLRYARFDGALLQNVDLRGSDLQGATFTRARIDEVDLSDCQLEDTEWFEADLRRFAHPDERQKQALKIAVIKPRPVHSLSRLNQKEEIASKNDLVGRDLRALNLAGCVFENVNMQAADLRGASLHDADLQRALMQRADLRGADLRRTLLNGAKLLRANLRAADLSHATLSGAFLDGTSLHSARLDHARLRRTSLVAADLQSTSLVGADLWRADLTDADLSDAVLKRARLGNARLHRASLLGADLSDADLSQAELDDVVATGANFTGATVTEEQLVRAERLGGAVFAADQIVAILHRANQRTHPLPEFLLFSEWLGGFSNLQIEQRKLLAAIMEGQFTKIRFSDVDLRYARLRGVFSQCSFVRANLTHARLSGTFSNVSFERCDFQAATLAGASFVGCDFSGAVNLDLNQLSNARRLRQTMLPGNIPYEGQFELSGDAGDAARTRRRRRKR